MQSTGVKTVPRIQKMKMLFVGDSGWTVGLGKAKFYKPIDT